jgi:divalent metal cation (Fe/Co/Zn/Cd) transporter
VTLHAKVPGGQTVAEAYEVVARIGESVRAAVPELGRVYTHIEPLARTDWARKPTAEEVADDRAAIEEATVRHTGAAPREVGFRDSERGRIALVAVELPADQPLRVAHRRAGAIEEQVREQRPDLADVVVQTEPSPRT